MAANIPNMGAINSMGGQFNTNVYAKAEGYLKRKAVSSQRKHIAGMKARQQARNDWAGSVNEALKNSANEVKQKQTQRNNQHGEALRMNADVNAKARYAKQAQASAQKAHAAGVKAGTAAPKPGAAPRTFAMPGNPVAKAQRSQVNTAHTDALREANQRANVMKQQVNYAHGQAFGVQNQMDRAKAKAAPVNQISKPTTKSSAPVKSAPAKVTGQFADVSTKNNAPFPTHVHPAGSSNMTMPNASAAHSAPGRPQTFTVGSRNSNPNGIAAAGSRLEAWAQSKTSAVQARQASKRAGGRDRGLAQQARQAESVSNQPLSGFAPSIKEDE